MKPPLPLKRQLAEQSGRNAETQAEELLVAQGWEILDRRVKTKVGEIDLVAARDGVIAFVEVKYRRDPAELDFAIDEYRLSRVAAAAEAVAHNYAEQGEDITIDVILLAPGVKPRHIANAWQP
jgi:putative endonuclease